MSEKVVQVVSFILGAAIGLFIMIAIMEGISG
jgi:hypothetical protein